jgi:hypothetical protein
MRRGADNQVGGMNSGNYPAPIPVSDQKTAEFSPEWVPNKTGITCRMFSGFSAEYFRIMHHGSIRFLTWVN